MMSSTQQGPRKVLLCLHPHRQAAVRMAREFVEIVQTDGMHVCILAEQAALMPAAGVEVVAELTGDIELVIVFGGDGTILWGAEIAREIDVPLLGMNLGHVGFLAEAEENELSDVAAAILAGDYRVEQRLALDVTVHSQSGELKFASWALNEVSLEKLGPTRMLDVLLSIDGVPLSRWGADGLLYATPTGSTAYAWSAGGPVVWPNVAALLVVPNAAHALFARPLVLGPDSVITTELTCQRPQLAALWCDGRRGHELGEGDVVTVCSSPQSVRLARLHSPAFVKRLVDKFHLPVQGWRGETKPND